MKRERVENKTRPSAKRQTRGSGRMGPKGLRSKAAAAKMSGGWDEGSEGADGRLATDGPEFLPRRKTLQSDSIGWSGLLELTHGRRLIRRNPISPIPARRITESEPHCNLAVAPRQLIPSSFHGPVKPLDRCAGPTPSQLDCHAPRSGRGLVHAPSCAARPTEKP